MSTWRNINMAILAATLAAAGSQAEAAVVELTKLSSTDLLAYVDVPPGETDVNGVHSNVFGTDSWIIGEEFGGGPGALPFFGPCIPQQGGGCAGRTSEEAWIEPGGDPNNLPSDHFSIVQLDPSGNRGVTQIGVLSDLSYQYLLDNFFFFSPGNGAPTYCANGPNGDFSTPCPILVDGESIDVPIQIFYSDHTAADTLTITFSEAVPEPPNLAPPVLGLIGIALWRRRDHRRAAMENRAPIS